MKEYMIILTMLISTNCFSQFIITDKFDYNNNIERGSDGYYYKDVTGYFDQFVGTWQYQEGNKIYTLKFKKKTFTESYPHVNTTYKHDVLVGALKVTVGGSVLFNDFPTFEQDLPEFVNYHIFSSIRIDNFDDCYMCTYPEQRIGMSYSIPGNDNYAFEDLGFMMHTYEQNGVVKLRVHFIESQVDYNNFWNLDTFWESDNPTSIPATTTEVYLPFGIHDFVKIN